MSVLVINVSGNIKNKKSSVLINESLNMLVKSNKTQDFDNGKNIKVKSALLEVKNGVTDKDPMVVSDTFSTYIFKKDKRRKIDTSKKSRYITTNVKSINRKIEQKTILVSNKKKCNIINNVVEKLKKVSINIKVGTEMMFSSNIKESLSIIVNCNGYRKLPKFIDEPKLKTIFVENKLKNTANNVKCLPATVMVNNIKPETEGRANIFVNSIPFKHVSVNVSNYKIPELGDNEPIAGLKNFSITTNKNSYFEYMLNFVDYEIEKIKGLPEGVQFTDNKIYGTPIISGTFSVTITLKDKTTVSGKIEIPNLIREL